MGFRRTTASCQGASDVLARARAFWLAAALALLALPCGPAIAQPVVNLQADSPQIALAPYTHYFHDPSGKQDADAVASHLALGHFLPLPGGKDTFGFQAGAYWFHVRLANHTNEPRWLLVQQYALSDYINVYQRYPGGRSTHQSGGDHLPFSARSIRYRHPNFWLDLPRDQPVDVLVRVQSESSMQVPLSLYTPTAFTEMARDAQTAEGVYYGILLSLFFYNFVLWLTLRDASYFWYLLHISAFGMVLFSLYGLGFEYLWPNSSWLADKSIPLSICLAQIGMQQFSRLFLGLKERWRFGDLISLGLIAFFILLGLASTQLGIRLSTQIAVIGVFVSIVWIAILGIAVVRTGYKPAQLFLLAWAMFLLGVGMVAAVAFSLLPKTFITEYGVQIGSALEMLLLSIALGYRYSALRNENERIVREAKEQLEHKVAQRTAELSSALGQLSDAHARLRESSKRDSLTGLYNRAYFREAFEGLLMQAQETTRPLALLMIDLDHFKVINDRYGHLVGDDCLRWAARTIGQALRTHDALLARFGGEEFVVALPGLHPDAATEVAEELRRRLHAEPFRRGELSIAVSTSVGVHAVDILSSGGIDAALQIADEALYNAKADGRNCVRTSQLPA